MSDTQYLIGKQTLDNIAKRIIDINSTSLNITPEDMIAQLDEISQDVNEIDELISSLINMSNSAEVLTPTCVIVNNHILRMSHNGMNIDFSEGYFTVKIDGEDKATNYELPEYDLSRECTDPSHKYIIRVASAGKDSSGRWRYTTTNTEKILEYTPVMSKPKISIEGNMLTITPSDTGVRANSYKVYYIDSENNISSNETTNTLVDLSTVITDFNFYTIYVTSCKNGVESAKSNGVQWTNIAATMPENKMIVMEPNSTKTICIEGGIKELTSSKVTLAYNNDYSGDEHDTDLILSLNGIALDITHNNDSNLIYPVYDVSITYKPLNSNSITTSEFYVAASSQGYIKYNTIEDVILDDGYSHEGVPTSFEDGHEETSYAWENVTHLVIPSTYFLSELDSEYKEDDHTEYYKTALNCEYNIASGYVVRVGYSYYEAGTRYNDGAGGPDIEVVDDSQTSTIYNIIYYGED